VGHRPCDGPVFADLAECIAERMRVLRANASYAPALKAGSAEEYIAAVSRVWATDPPEAKFSQRAAHWITHRIPIFIEPSEIGEKGPPLRH
jgi:hypothetical protein